MLNPIRQLAGQTAIYGLGTMAPRFLNYALLTPFYTRIFLGTEFEAGDSDYYVLLKTIKRGFKKGDPIPRFILERSVDGIIIAGKVPDIFIDIISEYNLPIVLIDYQTPNHEFPSVIIDNIQ